MGLHKTCRDTGVPNRCQDSSAGRRGCPGICPH